MRWWALALPLLLFGCNENQRVIVTAPPNIPEQRLKEIIPDSVMHCLREPDGRAVTTIRQSAKYIIDLRKAGADCRQKLAAVRDMILSEQ